ncbi:hypothetical protein [Novipirellula rosea]
MLHWVGDSSTCRRDATLCGEVHVGPRTHVRGYSLSSRFDW